jgi:hypothetical protein
MGQSLKVVNPHGQGQKPSLPVGSVLPCYCFREDAMIALQKILVPTDFSDFSQEALEFGLG